MSLAEGSNKNGSAIFEKRRFFFYPWCHMGWCWRSWFIEERVRPLHC